MDRQDGKDPFAATTYVVPMTINTMIELRAFCAAFFEENLRAQAKSMDQDLLTNFISLIAGSKKVFARARAVIPELQLLGPSDTSKMNPDVQRVMQLTEHLRRWPDADYEDLPEESVWSKLAKDGEAQRAKEAGVLFKKSLGHKRQASAASSPLRPPSTAEIVAVEKLTNMSPRPPSSKKSTPEGGVRLPPKLSSIPTFVPRDQLGNSEDLVWSPTSGTREKRPEERYQSPAKHAKTDSRIFGQEIQPNPSTMPKVPKPHPVLSSVIGETPKKGHNRTSSTDSVFVETEPYQSMPSPLGPKTNRLDFGWPKPDTPPKHRVRSGQKLELDREPGILDPQAALMYQNEAIWQTMSETAMTSEQYWQPQPSDISGPRYPSNRAHGVFGAEPFSAPPNIPAFDQMHISGQEPYGGSSSSSFMPQPSQDPYEQSRIPYSQPQPSRRNRTGARNPSIQHQLGEPSLESPPFQQQYDQMPPRAPRRNPYKHSQSPSFVPHHEVWSPNHPPPMTRLQQALYHSDPSIGTPDPNSESLVVPLPGSMPAIDYWNMLHQRETDIQTRLANANVPMTVLQQDYISRLGNARIAAVTSRLPLRGNKSSQLWLQILQKELNGIWEQRPGDQPQTAVVMDRKADYEKAVLREIEVALLEMPQEGQET